MSDCFSYAVAANIWSTVTKLPSVLVDFPMATLHGRPYVFGGKNSTDLVNNVYAFDSAHYSWTARAPMPRALWQHSVVAIDNDTAMM